MSLIEMLFTQQATITPFLREGNAEPIYGEVESRKCRIERGRYLVNTAGANGTADQVVANARMFCVGQSIPERSLIDSDGQQYVVINCVIMNGFGDHHLELYLQ